jgi:hypothetical protein
MPAVNFRFILLCGALLISLMPGANAAGDYERTMDGKTLVWNPDPRADDAVTWSGDRDKKLRHATGKGTVTWYRVEKKYALGSRVPHKKDIFLIQYSGNMVRGKLEGPVVAIDGKGKKLYADFAGGIRSGDWRYEPSVSPEPTAQKLESRRAEVVQPEAVAEASAAPSIPDPAPRDSTPSPSNTPRPDDVAQTSAAPLAATPLPREPSPPPVAAPRSEVVAAPAVSPIPKASPSPPPFSPAIVKKLPDLQVSASAPLTASQTANPLSLGAALPDSAQPPISPPARRSARKKRPQADDLLRSLALPPSSLAPGISLGPGTATAPSIPPAATSPVPSASAPAPAAASTALPARASLTSAEAIGLANAEARAHGNLLSDYQSPQAYYAPADETWSVLYDQKAVEGSSGVGKHFSVIVEDKTKKASIVPKK